MPAQVGLGVALIVLAAIVSDSRSAAPALLLVGVIALLADLARRRPTVPPAGPG